MPKRSKIKTPDWILNEKAPKKESKKEKVFRIKLCPKCKSDNVKIILSGMNSEEQSNTGKEWKCDNCGWKGKEIIEKELSEEEFLKYLDEKGEKVN